MTPRMSTQRMTKLRTLALVESATQLLNVMELAHTSGEAAGLRVAVLAPRDAQPRRQIAHVAELAAAQGIDVRTMDVRRLGAGAVAGGLRLTHELPRAQRLLVGDPFSRMIQTLLPLVRADEVIVVDDGTATWEFKDCVTADSPLIRWQRPHDRSAARAIRATRLLSPSPTRRLTVFSCLDGATPVGATGVANRYAWTRSGSRPEICTGEIDLVGSSLVESGVVDRRAYLDAVRRLNRRFPAMRYLAHRRESDNRLAEIAALPDVRVVRPALPVELALRQGPVAEHVITFPSTAAHTLPIVLGDLDVLIEVRPIDLAWFTPATTSHARDFVTRIAQDAPLRPVLEIA